jgi:hypothetical protein
MGTEDVISTIRAEQRQARRDGRSLWRVLVTHRAQRGAATAEDISSAEQDAEGLDLGARTRQILLHPDDWATLNPDGGVPDSHVDYNEDARTWSLCEIRVQMPS